MQDNYIKGFIKTAAQSANAPLFDLALPAKRKNGRPFWEGGTMKITVPATETNKVFTDALKKPIKLNQQQFRNFTPVHPHILEKSNLLSDSELRNRIQLIQTGALKDPRIRANQGSTSSSAAYGKLQKGKMLTDRIPMPVIHNTQQATIDNRLVRDMTYDKGLIDLSRRILNNPSSYAQFASPLQAAYVRGVLGAQRKAFLEYGRQPNKPGYQKRFDYSSYKDPTKGIGAQMVRSSRFDALHDKLDANYMSYLNSKAFEDYTAALKSGATTQQALTAYYNSLAANWYGDYRNKPGAKQNAMLGYANSIRNPNEQVASQVKKRDKMDAWWKNKTAETPLVPPNVQ